MTRSRLIALALALALGPVATPALAKGLDPEAAAGKRDELIASQPDEPRVAIDQLVAAAQELGDPELFLHAAELARSEADRARDDELAREAWGLALVARDIGLHLADERNYAATNWRPVTSERAGELADEAGELAHEAERLAEAIVAERAAAEAEARRAAELAAQSEQERRGPRPGTGLIAGGSALLTVGVGGLGMVGAGIALGQARQRDAEALVLPDQLAELDELDRQGAQANAIAYAGIGVATVGIAAGVALIVVGHKRRKAAGEDGETAGRVRVGGWVGHGGGLSVSGRF